MGLAIATLRARAEGRTLWSVALVLCCLTILAPLASAQDDGERIHVVRRGENLTGIARANGTTVRELREWNSLRSDRLLAGQELRVPSAGREWYTVRRGDTLSGIAERFDVSVSLLRQVNQLRGSRIHPGQKLKLQPTSTDEVVHVVRRGDTLLKIARLHGTAVSRLREINAIEGDRIHPGQKIRLRETSSGVHVVERGDALWEIARAYGMTLTELRELNELRGSRIYPGQELRVHGGPASAAPRYGSYTVQRGDTLGEIAQLHQMGLRELRSLNALDSSRIYPGQVLKVSPILGDSKGLGLLANESIPWDQLVPETRALPLIEASNGPYFFSRPKAASQTSDKYSEGSPKGPWSNYRQAKKLWDAFEAKVGRIGHLSRQLEGWTIVIDPGHGGVDPGTIVEATDGHGNTVYVVEDEYVYDIALRMYVLLTLHGADVTLTLLSPNHLLRGNDTAGDTYVHERNEVFHSATINKRNAASSWPRGGRTGLSRRRAIASAAVADAPKGKSLFLSLHADNSPAAPEAVTVFYLQNAKGVDRRSRDFARALLPALGAGARTRGKNLGVLRQNPATCEVLVEVRNLAYPSQAWGMRFEKLRHRDAEKLVKGILDFAGPAAVTAR